MRYLSAMFRACFHLVLCLSAAALTAGCASDRERLALESELRNRENEIRDLQQELTESEQLIRDQDAELLALRDARPAGGEVSAARLVSASVPAESLAAWGSVAAIQIHRLTSGVVPAIDSSSPPTINVVVQPVDEDGDLVKVAGPMRVTAHAVLKDGQSPRQIAEAEYDLTESRRIWSQGLVSSGMHVRLSCRDTIPADALLQLSATLNLGGDRSFSTTELISIP